MTQPAIPREFECIALVLQGGGALGAYQAGVFEGLAEAKISRYSTAVSTGAATVCTLTFQKRRISLLNSVLAPSSFKTPSPFA